MAYGRKSHRFNAYASWATFDTNNCSNFATPGAYGRNHCSKDAREHKVTKVKKINKNEHLLKTLQTSARGAPKERPRSAQTLPPTAIEKKKKTPDRPLQRLLLVLVQVVVYCYFIG